MIISSKIKEELDKVIDQLVKEKTFNIEKLTREQFVSALAQAISCGDFTRWVKINGDQSVTYIPFNREQELLVRISLLEKRYAEVYNKLDLGETRENLSFYHFST